ncbi:hypothetical protein [Anatilimnocola floriformis]|uniref:hypothetical protein n=1 Tax=Anatilimnocola floriformis TaxID=2948575 RepID=UPI0020C250DA|nr:hypothetical protein [Anatilimnocola floriformis]
MKPPHPEKSLFRQNLLGIFCLVMAIVALGLAVIPGIAFDRPPQPFVVNEPTALQPPISPSETTGGLTLRYKGLAVNFGGKTKPAEPTTAEAAAIEAAAVAKESQAQRDHMLKCFMLAAAGCSMLALVCGPFAWVQEKQPAISGPAMLIATVALTWQYIAFGIAVGMAIAITLLICGAFS